MTLFSNVTKRKPMCLALAHPAPHGRRTGVFWGSEWTTEARERAKYRRTAFWQRESQLGFQ